MIHSEFAKQTLNSYLIVKKDNWSIVNLRNRQCFHSGFIVHCIVRRTTLEGDSEFQVHLLKRFRMSTSKRIQQILFVNPPWIHFLSSKHFESTIDFANWLIFHYLFLRALFTLKILSHCSEPIREGQFGRWLCPLQSAIRISMTSNIQCEKGSEHSKKLGKSLNLFAW